MLNPELLSNRRPSDRIARNPSLAKLAETVQPFVQKLLGSAGQGARDLLHGTQLGHPLHPVATDVPVGGWTVAAVLDALECLGRTDVAFAADTAIVVGLAGGVLSIASGYAEWSDTAGEARTLGYGHGLLNGVAFTGYLASLVLRRTGRRPAGIATAFASYAVCGLASYLGGELSFGMQLGVRHTAEPLVPPNDYTAVLAESELPEEGAVRADFGGVPVLVSRSASGVAAISAICTHRGAPLSAADVADGCVRCPWHGSLFRLDDGSIVNGPASFPQPRFDARLRGGSVELRMLQEP
ncbi:MAG: Rieske (2Fe-2S) protein [Candidatus Eremiobacteraeota bacterium]|nr:Rieske (2Fe-2S) protein [Candidatus Eremiobacteraeota bacterium]